MDAVAEPQQQAVYRFLVHSRKGSSHMSAQEISLFASIRNLFFVNLRLTIDPTIWAVLVLIPGTFATIDNAYAQVRRSRRRSPNPR